TLPAGVETNYAQIDENGGAGGKSHIIIPYVADADDYITGQKSSNIIHKGTVTPGTVFYEFGQIESKETYTFDHYGLVSTLNTSAYTYDMGLDFINRAKPISVTTYSEISQSGS